MNQFVQIGDRVYNLQRLELVSFTVDRVELSFGSENWDRLEGEEAKRFRDWWDHHADVWVIGKGQEDEQA